MRYSVRVIVVKKDTNRRLYDTETSQYVTLEELADKIRRGTDVRVVDAKSNDDITQATLVQIIIESRGAAKLLPVPMLMQLIRMGDDALAEFFGRYMSGALELYQGAKAGAQALTPYNPFAAMPCSAGNALARMFMGGMPWGSDSAPSPGAPSAHVVAQPPPSPPPSRPSASAGGGEVAALRRELEEIKQSLRKRRK